MLFLLAIILCTKNKEGFEMINYKKIYRGARLAGKIFEARLMKKRMPLNVYLLVTNRCNLKCFYCFSKVYKRKMKDLPLEKLFAIIDELVFFGTRYIILEGGEPLLRDDIGDIIDYIKSKNVVCELITNGYFIRDRIKDVRKLDSLCLSVDGDRESHDRMRGKGSHAKAMEGLNMAVANKIPIRLHATLTRYNYNSLDYLVNLAKKAQAILTISQASIHTNHKALKFSKEEIRIFWIRVLKYKRLGYPIRNSYESLNYVINWPYSYNHILRKKDSITGFKPIPCSLGHLSCNVDVNGTVYPCSVLFHKNGYDLFKMGIRKIWECFKDLDCISCGHVNQVEQSLIFSGHIRSIYNSAKYFLTN